MEPLLTTHAQVRMQQRGISADVLDTLLDFGRVAHLDRGKDIVFFDKKACERLKKMDPKAARLFRTYAILGRDGWVVTVGHRYRRIQRI